MLLIIGLGNPGKEYEKTKHNAGFRTVDFLAEKYDLEWTNESKKLLSDVSSGTIDSKKVILAKPLTFMNSSGVAAKKLVTNYKLQVTNLFTVHDDSDLLLGKIKISFGKSSGGHKGVESVIKALRTKDFWRLRIGIQPPPAAPRGRKKRVPAAKLVLQKLKPDEEKITAHVVKKAASAIELAIAESPEKAMSMFNQ